MQADDQAYVDASPTLADAYIGGGWKTVLVSAEGNGGDSVFCLDVTDPFNPLFLWEFADPDLFRSRSSPTVGLGRMIVGGEAQWVALFVSGKSSSDEVYPSIYIVNVEDGVLIDRVYLDAEPDGVGGVPSGQPAIVDSDGNGFIDRLYIGTDKGFMYKVNLPDDPQSSFTEITHCVINTDFEDEDNNIIAESQRYHPVYASPAVTIDNSLSQTGELDYSIKIFFGTGDSPYYDEDINTAETRYHFFAYNDRDAKGICGSSVVLDWFYELPEGHRIFASAFSAAGNIYFGTSTAETEDPCEATGAGKNAGKLFVFSTEGVQKQAFNTGNIISAPLVEDEHLYFRTSEGLNSLGGSTYNNNTIVTGTGTSQIISWEEISD
jgi:type IV pilus assembly protein PilY1